MMNRYEVKRISDNWFGIWDNVRNEFMIESTGHGIKVYAEVFGI